MKRSSKTVLTALICSAMIAAAGSCAMGQTYPLTVDGEQIRAGIYILEQDNAISKAKEKLKEEQPDLDTSADGFSYFDQTIEGKKFEDWVNDKAIENCRNYIAIERLFDQYGLTLDKDDIDSTNDYVSRLWTEENQYAMYIYGVNIVGQYYEKVGVGEQSFKELQYMSTKSEDIFNYLYGENGIKAATEEEINASLSSDYAALNYFQYQLESGDSAEQFAERIKNGESFETVYRDYTQLYNKQEDAKKAAEAAETGVEETDEPDTGDGTAEETPAEETEMAVPAADSLVKIVQKDETAPSEDFVKQAFEMSNGEIKVITITADDVTSVYVVQKLDILTKPELTGETVKTIRSELKRDEYQDLIKSTGDAYTVTVDGSRSMYKVKTLLESRQGIYG